MLQRKLVTKSLRNSKLRRLPDVKRKNSRRTSEMSCTSRKASWLPVLVSRLNMISVIAQSKSCKRLRNSK